MRDITASAKAQGDLTFSHSTSTATQTPRTKPAGQTYPCTGEACDGRLRRMKGKKGVFWGCSNYGQGCREPRLDARGKPVKTPAPRQTARVSKHAVVAVGKTCPECKKGKIQLRSLKSGNNAGKPFHGYSAFPKCRYFAWPADMTDEASALTGVMPEWLEKTPWPAQGIESGTSPEDYRWGYLYLFRDGRPKFREDERPTLREIKAL